MVKNDYFPYLQEAVSEDLFTLYTQIEQCFKDINYDNHIDTLNNIFLNSDDTNADNAFSANQIYRSHIDTVLGLQGVCLLSPYDDKLSTITVILQTVCTLAKNKPSEIFNPKELEESDSSCELLSHVVELVTDFPSVNILPLLESVDERLVVYIHEDNPSLTIINDTMLIARDRFKNCTLEKTGVAVEVIKSFNRFGYTVDSFIKEAGANLALLGTVDLAKEIVLLVLGSNTPTEKLVEVMLELAELLTETALEATSTQSLIYRMVPSYDKK